MTDFDKQSQRRRRQRQTAYMAGWDSVLTDKKQNPYKRRDFADRFDDGRKACLAGAALPVWYSDWRNKWKEL